MDKSIKELFDQLVEIIAFHILTEPSTSDVGFKWKYMGTEFVERFDAMCDVYRIVIFNKETDTCITYMDMWQVYESDNVHIDTKIYNIRTEFSYVVHDIVSYFMYCPDFVKYQESHITDKPPEKHLVDLTLTNLTIGQVAYIMEYLK